MSPDEVHVHALQHHFGVVPDALRQLLHVLHALELQFGEGFIQRLDLLRVAQLDLVAQPRADACAVRARLQNCIVQQALEHAYVCTRSCIRVVVVLYKPLVAQVAVLELVVGLQFECVHH